MAPPRSGRTERVRSLPQVPGDDAVTAKLATPPTSSAVHDAAVDGSTRSTHAAGPPFSKKPNADSAVTPRAVAAPKVRTKSGQPVILVGSRTGPLRVVPRIATTLVGAAAIGWGPDGTSSM